MTNHVIPEAAVNEKAASFAEYNARLAREAKTRARKESQVNPKRK